MASTGPARVLLHILNIIITVLSVAVACASIWFFVQVNDFTNLRNKNHYLLDYNVYWPQIIPWLFFVVSLLVICVVSCGFAGTRKGRKGLLFMYMVSFGVVAVLMITVAVLAFVFTNHKQTDDFVKDTVWDAYVQTKNDPDVANSFALIERKLHCCGADGPRDYKNWRVDLPQSCCDTYYHGWLSSYPIECDFTNKLANERHGCSQVAMQYTKIVIMVLAAVCILIAILGFVCIAVAAGLSKALRRKNRVMAAKLESESEKVLI
ncbi:unnamed protein product [Plutella xylostella]|uniref:Tetraspanin n=1 Tax=Plutella xylostella TaxID=51655 RepID=A0A8S4G6T9_PLUXY|nr:23 kDa integral membrane protein [Plutella xylostella]CAG9136825.1 unnamed protein product [Plutella xylostella]